jgi:hypothetical protein
MSAAQNNLVDLRHRPVGSVFPRGHGNRRAEGRISALQTLSCFPPLCRIEVNRIGETEAPGGDLPLLRRRVAFDPLR